MLHTVVVELAAAMVSTWVHPAGAVSETAALLDANSSMASPVPVPDGTFTLSVAALPLAELCPTKAMGWGLLTTEIC